MLGDLLDEESAEAAPNVYELHLFSPSVRVILGPVHVVRRAWDVEHLVVQRVTVRTSTIQPLFGLQTNIYKKQKTKQKRKRNIRNTTIKSQVSFCFSSLFVLLFLSRLAV